MQIRMYVGADEKELLRKIRAELGADAVILHSTYGKRSGLFGFFAKPRIEIVAGGGFKIVKDYPNGEAAPAGPPKPSAASAEMLQKEIGEIKRLIAETIQPGIAVLSYNEVVQDVKVESLGMVAAE